MKMRALLGYAAPYRRSLALSGLLMLMETGISLAVPWLGGKFAQHVLAGTSASSAPILLILLAFFTAQALLKFASSYLMSRTETRILADLRTRLYDHLQALPLTFFQQRRHGHVLSLLTDEVPRLSDYIAVTLQGVLPQVLTIAGAVVFMFHIDFTLGLLVTLAVPVFYIFIRTLGRHLRPIARELQSVNATAIAIADENLGMLPTIKAFTREAEESNRYRGKIAEIRQLSERRDRLYAALEPVAQLITASAVLLLLWLASARIGDGQLAPAELISLLLYAALITRPIGSLASVYGHTEMAKGTLQRLQEVLTERVETISQAGNELPAVRGNIDFKEVVFSYPDRPPAIRGLTLQISAGETVAITGDNGAGKSTLMHLLMRLYEPQSGHIFIDGFDTASVSLHSLRRQIGVVPQHVLLFNGSVQENIAFGLAGATRTEVEQAARLAQAHDFITRLPQSYDTNIGDQGVKLSGGQRQRIALARALLKNPPILVLDEATAMFDPKSEKSFVEDFRHLLGQRTVILITHRPASLSLADRVIRLKEGSVYAVDAL